VVIHNREADDEVYEHIKEIRSRPRWDPPLLLFGLCLMPRNSWTLGFYVSFAGNLTYKKSTAIQEAAAKTPMGENL
jgi:Tat protein secretion system quality control protein TatD with DNase activity